MALRALKPCAHIGCRTLTRDGYCPKHKPKDRRSAEAASWHAWYSKPIFRDELRPMQLLKEPCAVSHIPSHFEMQKRVRH